MRTIIIDDEKQIREGLKIIISKIKAVKIIGEAATILEGKTIIEDLKPDLVLLDIQLKNHTGFELLERLEQPAFKLIFITAYNQYAIKAFKYNAFDYLLKPVDPEELEETINRLIQQRFDSQKQLEILKTNQDLNKIVIKTTDQVYIFPIEDIVRCEADQGYTHFYTKDQQHVLSSKTLKEYNNILPENQFIRIHQSHLVNWKYVVSFHKKRGLILSNNDEVPVSVRKRHLVTELLK